MQLEDWLDDLCVRFIVNLPPEELVSVERICFQVEEAQWFYEDFVRPLDPSLPSLSLKAFSLRIFQHCPLFSTWSVHHYTSAFAEFLAYKQRVPVRGAIMLNEEMDEVVLVKGWKKGANWSFPRGKINKDENDLDCAIREVYEETGYDIQSAGLVKPEREMKYIEVTMREQHMRLYVFRGVPKDTHFEPRTRKEISKIEWYKLTDLPTLKKKAAHHDAQDDSAILNANKFYMVAPFLHPLKKWITQQKKKENRYSSSHLAAPPMVLDESATDGEPGPVTYVNYQPQVMSPAVPSSLPEVATTQTHATMQDPSQHLKQLLKIGVAPQPGTSTAQSHPVHHGDSAKSNALLALLRNGSTVENQTATHTSVKDAPVEPHEAPPHQQIVSALRPALSMLQPAPQLPNLQSRLPDLQRSLLHLFSSTNAVSQKAQQASSPSVGGIDNVPTRPIQESRLPYQRTGDPQFARDSPEETRTQMVPSADALPKLTHHTKALLHAFKAAQTPSSQAPEVFSNVAQTAPAANRQALLNAFKRTTPDKQEKIVSEYPSAASTIPSLRSESSKQPEEQTDPMPHTRLEPSNASSLLRHFMAQEKEPSKTMPPFGESLQAPVELAAGPAMSPRPQQASTEPELLSLLLRKDAPKRLPQATRAGETAATIDGPLNQPHFESVAKSPSQISTESMRRSPVPAHRTLFNPKQPTPSKILQRPEESKRIAARSPRPSKAVAAVSSPKSKARSKPEKAFQPQILRRPQQTDSREVMVSSPAPIARTEDQHQQTSPSPAPKALSPQPIRPPTTSPSLPSETSRRTSQQTESQKQNLLSLLTGNVGSMATVQSHRQPPTPGAVSPLTQSQIMSPLGEEPPISTRSRMGSLVSITSPGPIHDPRSKVEKRQTAAGDKAFLLGYLGRIANEGGQSQQ